MHKLVLICLIAAMGASLSACGKAQEDADTEMEIDLSAESVEEQDIEEIDVGESDIEQELAEVTPGEYNGFYQYMLDQSMGGNAVFSSESLCSAFCLYASTLTDDGKTLLHDFTNNVDYLAYESTDAFKTVNRLWINSALDFHPEVLDLPADLVYMLDMSDSDAATREKNNFVNEMTNGFIGETPAVFDEDTQLDAMNIVYFKDTWAGGDKELSSEPIPFANADGTISNVNMIDDYAGVESTVYYTDNAHACTMPYSDGFTFTAILPDDPETSLYDIDIDAFINNTADAMDYDKVSLCIPEFETQSIYQCGFDTFGLDPGPYDPAFCEMDHFPSIISQVAKIKFDHKGTEAAAVSEVINVTNGIASDEPASYRMVCDRPFVYFIRDTVNNDIAFLGVVSNMS